MKILYVYIYKYILIIITLWFLYKSFVASHLQLVDFQHSRAHSWFPAIWKRTSSVLYFSFAASSSVFTHMHHHQKYLGFFICNVNITTFPIFLTMASLVGICFQSLGIFHYIAHMHLGVCYQQVSSVWCTGEQQSEK